MAKDDKTAVETGAVDEIDELEARLKEIENAERAIDQAYTTGKAERAKITQSAQLDAAEAVAMAGIAMESDVEADEAMRLTVIAEKMGDREKIREARKKERESRKKAKQDHKAATESAKRAYDAIKFSAPNTMGFMRVVQVIFAIHIGTALVWLMLTSRDSMQYNVSSMLDWVMIILEGVAFWMFINRYKIARPFVIAMAAIGLVVPVVYDVATNQFNVYNLVFNGGFYLFLILYFIFSKRVESTLVNDLSKNKGEYEKEDFRIQRHGWPFVRNLIIYFIVFSIVGHWMEMGMCQFIIMGLVEGEYDPNNTMLWRDVLYPFPMEGAAVVIIALVLYPFYLWLKKKVHPTILAYLISFLAGALLCSIIEFSMGMFVNANHELWDYSDNFGNIMGQVCLQNTTAFGVMASIITWWVYPLLERWIARVPRDIMNIAFVVIAVFGALVWSLYLINPPGVDEANLPENKDKQEEVEEQHSAHNIATVLSEINEDLDDLEETIDESSRDDKAELKKKVAKMRQQTKEMLVEDLALSDYPNIYERMVAFLNQSWTPAAASASAEAASATSAEAEEAK